MTDVVHARDAVIRRPRGPAPTLGLATPQIDRRNAPPRTDIGTITLHWATATAFLISLLTGLRIAADNLDAVVSRWLSPILPQGEIWTWHFFAGLALFFCGSAYLLYMRRSGLARRAAPKKLRVFFLPVVSKLRFGALNVALHWALYSLVVVLTGTGIMLYLGYGGWWVYVHSTAAFVGLAYIFVHVTSHYLYGGWQQLFRVFRPAALVATKAMRPRPLLVGTLAGVGIVTAVVGIDWVTRDTLVVRRVATAPQPERLLDDPVWTNVRPVRIRTQQGTSLGGTGESLVEVRSVHDGSKIYFAFRWEDPTRSLRRNPLIKREDGWHIFDERAGWMDIVNFYEDKFSVVFAEQASFGASGVAHFGGKPLADKPAPLNRRGLHYTTDGSYMDMWQWKASRGGHLGYMDDQYIGPPREPNAAQIAGKARYQAGYWDDPGRSFYSYNYKDTPTGGTTGPIELKRLPKEVAATSAKLGHYSLDPNAVDTEGAHWWMTESESAPYSPELDAKIPVGTVIPGVLVMGNYEGDRAQVRASVRWHDGHWTLVASRDLVTGSKYDKDFVSGKDLYMWVAVFDHTQTRHTRHPRPVRVVVQN
jgi:hypothetical protein